ncbi:MAG: hypothetical protein V4489_07180 [Chlamydiota bacterium]
MDSINERFNLTVVERQVVYRGAHAYCPSSSKVYNLGSIFANSMKGLGDNVRKTIAVRVLLDISLTNRIYQKYAESSIPHEGPLAPPRYLIEEGGYLGYSVDAVLTHASCRVPPFLHGLPVAVTIQQEGVYYSQP